MTKQISIHKAEFHKYVFLESEEVPWYLDDRSFGEKFVQPIKDKTSIYVFDIKNKLLLKELKENECIEIDSETNRLKIIGIPLEQVAKINILNKVEELEYYAADLLKNQLIQKNGDRLWSDIIFVKNLYKFNETSADTIMRYGQELKHLYKQIVLKDISVTALENFLKKLGELCIDDLTMGSVFIHDTGFKLLSELRSIKILVLLESYNITLANLPDSIVNLTISESIFQNLSDIYLDLPNLVELHLRSNMLKYLDGLQFLPVVLKVLDLSDNFITNFYISKLPEGLEELALNSNLIDNHFFSQNAIHENLKCLGLANTNIVVNPSVLKRILEIFPKLERLDLRNNKYEGINIRYVKCLEEENCLEGIQDLLRVLMDKNCMNQSDNLNVSNSRFLNDYVEISWKGEFLPINWIRSEVQNKFTHYLIQMRSYLNYVNGVYCFIEHDNCELFIIFNEENKNIFFRIQSDNPEIVSLYMYKYLNDLNDIICKNHHVNLLPRLKYSVSCEFLDAFYKKAFSIDYKSNYFVLNPDDVGLKVLINNHKKLNYDETNFGITTYDPENPDDSYTYIDNIAFVFFYKRKAYPFIIENDFITNIMHNKSKYFCLTLVNPNKGIYRKALNSEYLKAIPLAEGNVLLKGKKNGECIVNQNHIKILDGKLKLINDRLKLNKKYLRNVTHSTVKAFEFIVKDDLILIESN